LIISLVIFYAILYAIYENDNTLKEREEHYIFYSIELFARILLTGFVGRMTMRKYFGYQG